MTTALTVQSIAKSINGNLLPDNKTHRMRMEIRSESSNRIYIVSQRLSNSQYECSCPGWIRHRNCKHLTAMKPALQQITKLLDGVK